MFCFKKVIIYCIFTVIMFMFIVPSYSFADDEISFVWSDTSNPIVETVSSFTSDKREFFESYFWKCNSN